MSISDFAVRPSFPQQVTSNTEWYRLAQRATDVLSEEVRNSGVVIPALVADWTIALGNSATPAFELSLSDTPNDPHPVRAQFTLDRLRDDEAIRQDMQRVWRQLLRHRSRRQAESIGMFIKGHAEE